MAGAKGKVILFGKTGGGKSTVANSLVTGGIEDVEFTIGHGFSGCTRQVQTSEGRGWTVTDTVGLGEGEVGRVSNEDAEKIILKFLACDLCQEVRPQI
jgi:predicted GTPase